MEGRGALMERRGRDGGARNDGKARLSYDGRALKTGSEQQLGDFRGTATDIGDCVHSYRILQPALLWVTGVR